MAEKGFGVKEINLIGASGTPTIESPNNLSLNAVNVAISTNATIGGTLAVSGVVTATSFSGSGANLTNLPASVPADTDVQVTYDISDNGNNYRITGPGHDSSENNPDLYLVRGQRYRFINGTGSSHPFRIQSDTSGTQYTDGVTGDQDGTQDFNVQNDAPARLYYQCTIHSGMIGNIYIVGGSDWRMTDVTTAQTPEIYTNLNVGIGTDNPSSKLEVLGSTLLKGTSSTATALNIRGAGTQGDDATISFTNGYTQTFKIGMSDDIGPSRDFIISETSTGSSSDEENPKYIFNGNGDGIFQITDRAGGDIKIQLNSNGNSYLDSGDVGIGTNNPRARLEINTTHNATPNIVTPVLRLSTDHYNGLNTGSALEFGTTQPSYPTWVKARIAGTYSGGSSYGGDIKFEVNTGSTATGLTTAMHLNHNGVLRLPFQPAFHASGNSNALVNSSNTIIIGNTVDINTGGCYDSSNGRFTAPVDGNYQFSFWGLLYPHSSGVINTFYSKNGVQWGDLVQGGSDSNSHTSRAGSIIMNMSAGDYTELRINRSTNSSVEAYGTQWNMSGFLIG